MRRSPHDGYSFPSVRRAFLSPLRSEIRSQRPARYRRLFLEQFEDRRLLATAVDDNYSVVVNHTLTVTGYGAISNDSFDSTWDLSHWNGYWETIDDYDENGNWISDHQEWVRTDWYQGADGHMERHIRGRQRGQA